MNRTIKDATVKRYFYETHDELRVHLRDFVDAYNFARRLKTLKGLTPYEFVCKAWTSQPNKFTNQPAPENAGTEQLSNFHVANQQIGFLRLSACADSRGVWHGGKVFNYGER